MVDAQETNQTRRSQGHSDSIEEQETGSEPVPDKVPNLPITSQEHRPSNPKVWTASLSMKRSLALNLSIISSQDTLIWLSQCFLGREDADSQLTLMSSPNIVINEHINRLLVQHVCNMELLSTPKQTLTLLFQVWKAKEMLLRTPQHNLTFHSTPIPHVHCLE